MATAVTSGTYNFQTIQVELIIREAFERIGISGEFIVPVKLESATRSLNFILLEWMSKTTNTWSLDYDYITLNTSQYQYSIPLYVNNIIQANLRTSTRQLNGTPASSAGGNAANAFDNDPNSGCVQNAPDGNISYDYGVGNSQQITFVGIESGVNQQQGVDNFYTLLVEHSEDLITWRAILVIPKRNYYANQPAWFDIPVPVAARAYRIREIGGATLDINGIYFNNDTLDMPISKVSRYEYFTYPQKQLQSRPSVIYFDFQGPPSTPSVYIWPSVSDLYNYNTIQYTYQKMIQDVGSYTNAIQVPALLYPALVAELSYRLAIKYNPQIAEMLKADAQESFNLASIETAEGSPIKISADFGYVDQY